jgi:hypothetical protein
MVSECIALEAEEYVGIPPSRITVELKTMKLSGGREEHYVSISCGGRETTPSMYPGPYKNRAIYEVDNWKHVLFGHPKPDLLDPKYDDPKEVQNANPEGN